MRAGPEGAEVTDVSHNILSPGIGKVLISDHAPAVYRPISRKNAMPSLMALLYGSMLFEELSLLEELSGLDELSLPEALSSFASPEVPSMLVSGDSLDSATASLLESDPEDTSFLSFYFPFLILQ